MNFEESYRKLKTRIERYCPNDITSWALKHMQIIENRPLNENPSLLPWELLTLARLGIIHGGRKYPAKVATENDMRKLLNKVKDTGSITPILKVSGTHKLHKFVRVVAHQQYIYQINFSSWKFGRQIQLFKLLPCRYPISEKFLHYTGLTIEEFFEFSLVFLTLMMNNSLSFPFDPAKIHKSYPKNNIYRFLDLLSLNWQSAKQELLSPEMVKIKDPQLQFFDQSPFLRYPFIKYNDNQYFFISQKVFEQTISNFVYDLLKAKEPNEFAQEFGKLTFEAYLELGLKHTKLPYITEATLRTHFPKNQKVVDYTILEDDCTVLVECKAIEMKPYTKVFPITEVMTREFKSSVIKALEQIYSVANELKIKAELADRKVSPNLFAFVVTYKELFLGPGQLVWDEFLQDELTPHLKQKGIDIGLLPPHRIFYISVECFDDIVNVVSNSEHKLSEILEHASIQNQNPANMKFLLDWFLHDDFRLPLSNNTLNYLQEPTDAVFKQLANTLGHDNVFDKAR